MGESTKITVEGTGSIENAMKVAFATKDMETINAHFGGAKEFVVYNLGKEGFEFSDVVKTDTSKLTLVHRAQRSHGGMTKGLKAKAANGETPRSR